ncbi:lamin tail domain-containing protein [Bacteroidota bacterium]
MRFVSTSMVILLCNSVFGQIYDSFTDNNYSSDPAWSGDADKFVVELEVLRLFDPDGSGLAFLSTNGLEASNIGYEFYINLKFNPSGQNFCDIYLVSDNLNLKNPLHGYFLRIGGTNDEISLFRQDGLREESVKIIDGEDGKIDLSEVKVRILLIREESAEWSLFSDVTGSNKYSLEGKASDDTYLPAGYFGFLCTYTTTRSDKFFFDDLIIKNDPEFYSESFYIDTVWSELPNSINVKFNRTFHLLSAENRDNYVLNPGNVQPDSILTFPGENRIILYFPTLYNNTDYRLGIYNVESSDGITLNGEIYYFTYYTPYKAETGDIIINEILGDPTPAVNLPEVEYIELFNKTEYAINLSDFELNENPLPSCIIYPDDFLILCRMAEADLFSEELNAIGMIDWNAINNDGELISLIDPEEKLIDMFIYDPDLITDPEKKNGGWSIERINPYLACDYPANWRVSENSTGGTPSSVNSVYNDSPDMAPPYLVNSKIHQNIIILTFSEPVEFPGLKSENIQFNGFIVDEIFSNEWNDEFRVSFDRNFSQGEIYEIILTEVTDCAGNVMQDTIFRNGIGKMPGFQEVVITEIMADPLPSIGLPETEYLEIFNPTDNIINLIHCLLIVGKDSMFLPSYNLFPKEYLVLCKSSSATSLENYCDALEIKSFPSINNKGDQILLLDSLHDPIHILKYSNEWYGSIDKDDGGYSMEMIDAKFPHRTGNWKASQSHIGGTPGSENSISEDYPDLTGPRLIQAISVSPDSVILSFDEQLHPYIVNNSKVDISNGAILSGIYYNFCEGKNVCLIFRDDLVKGTIYHIEATNITDCAGNIIQDGYTSFSLILPKDPDSADILINELLFQPLPGGAEFIEIYNTSDKHIDLNNWEVARLTENNIEYSTPITSSNLVMAPGSYLALCQDPKLLKADFPFAPDEHILKVDQLPILPNSQGEICLIMPDRRFSDYFFYKDSYHNGLLYDTEGVSLERIYTDHNTNNPENWHSASYDSGYGTPGVKNSQSKIAKEYIGEIMIDPKVFIPDYGVSMQMVTINYQMADPGFNANVEVYNMEGRKVRSIAQNAILGTSGLFTWDGSNDQGLKSNSGYYIIFIEAWNLNGDIRRFKETVVVGSRF